MKVPDGSCVDCMLACKDTQISDGQGSMSKQRGGADCEYTRRLRERAARSNRLS